VVKIGNRDEKKNPEVRDMYQEENDSWKIYPAKNLEIVRMQKTR